jgi:hypothetical protein
MYYNLKDIETIVDSMKCEYADLVYKDLMRKEYALKTKPCSQEALTELQYFIPVMEYKQAVLKNFQQGSNYYSYPQRLFKTDLDTFWNQDDILSDCSIKTLEKFKHRKRQKSVLNLSQSNNCENCG